MLVIFAIVCFKSHLSHLRKLLLSYLKQYERVVDKLNSLPTYVKIKPFINSFKDAFDDYHFEIGFCYK